MKYLNQLSNYFRKRKEVRNRQMFIVNIPEYLNVNTYRPGHTPFYIVDNILTKSIGYSPDLQAIFFEMRDNKVYACHKVSSEEFESILHKINPIQNIQHILNTQRMVQVDIKIFETPVSKT